MAERRMLNKNASYGTNHPPIGGAVYFQDGRYFDGQGYETAWSAKHGPGAEVGVGRLGTMEKASGMTVEQFERVRDARRAGPGAPASAEHQAFEGVGVGDFISRAEQDDEFEPDPHMLMSGADLPEVGPPSLTLNRAMIARPHDDLPDLAAWARGEKDYPFSLVRRAVQQFYFKAPLTERQAVEIIAEKSGMSPEQAKRVNLEDEDSGRPVSAQSGGKGKAGGKGGKPSKSGVKTREVKTETPNWRAESARKAREAKAAKQAEREAAEKARAPHEDL